MSTVQTDFAHRLYGSWEKSMLYRNLILCLLLFFSCNSFAEPYLWHHSITGATANSAVAACPPTRSSSYWDGPAPLQLKFNDVSNATCHYSAQYGAQWGSSAQYSEDYGNVYRTGDTCSEGATYNTSTGACDMPTKKEGELCDDQEGHGISNPMIFSTTANKCVSLTESDDKATCAFFGNGGKETSYTVAGVLNSGGEAVAPPTFAGNMNCEASTVKSSDCTINVQGQISCNVTAVFTGKVANTTLPDVKESQCPPEGCAKKQTETTNSETPCVPTNGSCTSETKTETTGSQSCGTANGVYVCVTKKPTSQGTKVESTIKSEPQPDGGVKTTRTDNATQERCTDVKSCTLKTSSTTTSSTTSKTGEATSTKSTCFGDCGSSGKGLGTTGNGGNGDGDGDGEGDSASASEDCKIPPPCDGDPFLCAILKQEFHDSCAERALPTDSEKDDLKKLIADQKTKQDENQKEMDDKATSLISGFQSAGSGSGGGKCFEDKSYNILGHAFALPFSQACPILDWFRYAITAISYLIALRIVTKDL